MSNSLFLFGVNVRVFITDCNIYYKIISITSFTIENLLFLSKNSSLCFHTNIFFHKTLIKKKRMENIESGDGS